MKINCQTEINKCCRTCINSQEHNSSGRVCKLAKTCDETSPNYKALPDYLKRDICQKRCGS